MSVANTSARPAGNTNSNILLGVGLLVVMMFLFFLGQFSKGVSLNRSAIGFDGLPLWLNANEIDARTFYGRAVLEPETVGLRILPLFDVDLIASADKTNDEEAAMAETERDITLYTVRRKIETLPTLLVLPKWRSGVRQAEAVHPELLISKASAQLISSQIEGDIGTLFQEKDVAEITAQTPNGETYLLHYRQTLRGSSCTPLIGSRDAILLGRCTYDGFGFWVLSDPDLLNNHGLTQGDNAAAALNWLPNLTEVASAEAYTPETNSDSAEPNRAEIVLDLTSSNWVRRVGGRDMAQRSWSDLGRFFEYPFSVIWWSFGILGALTFWRAWRRYGAADARSEEEKGPQASRLVSIDTKARLLRLADRDDSLVRTHIDARLETLADEILGPQRTRGAAGLDRLMSAVARRSPDLSKQFDSFRQDAETTATSPEMLMRRVAQFDDLIERTLDEFGRSGRAR